MGAVTALADLWLASRREIQAEPALA